MNQLQLTADDTRFFATRDWIKDSVRPRITGERLMVRTLAKVLLDHGYSLRVWEGEDWACDLTSDLDTIMDNIMSTDDDKLYVYRGHPHLQRKSIGWVLFVYGNMANEVINNYTTNLEPFMKKVNEVEAQLLAMHL